MNNISKNRIKRELQMLSTGPPSGISCSSVDDKLDTLSAQIIGEDGTPFEGGVFHLDIQIPDRYPFDPPSIRFLTPIYHPNIDSNGRICLDTLKLPPKGSWRPCLNISSVLMMIRILMAEPGAEDPLMTAIWQEYKYNYTLYVEKARQWTRQHAKAASINMEMKDTNATMTCTSSKDQQEFDEKRRLTKLTHASDSEHREETVRQKAGAGLSIKRPALRENDVNSKVIKHV